MRQYGIALSRLNGNGLVEYLLVPGGNVHSHEATTWVLPASIPGFRDSEKDAGKSGLLSSKNPALFANASPESHYATACRALIDSTPLEEYDFCILHDKPPISYCNTPKLTESESPTLTQSSSTLTLFYTAFLKPSSSDCLERDTEGLYKACWCDETVIATGSQGDQRIAGSVWEVVRQIQGKGDGGMVLAAATAAALEESTSTKVLAEATKVPEGPFQPGSSSRVFLESLKNATGALPVTVLSGFLGGKFKHFKHLQAALQKDL